MNWPQIEEITYSECDNPHKLLGPHKQGSKMLVQAYFPGAEKVTIHWKKTGQVGEAFLRSNHGIVFSHFGTNHCSWCCIWCSVIGALFCF